jgi:hypothetical protein
LKWISFSELKYNDYVSSELRNSSNLKFHLSSGFNFAINAPIKQTLLQNLLAIENTCAKCEREIESED